MTKDEATAFLAWALRDIAPEVDLGAVDRDLPLQEVADIDPISFMTLVTAIGDRTGIQIPVYPRLQAAERVTNRRPLPAPSENPSGSPSSTSRTSSGVCHAASRAELM
jgi:hypothetical protein